MTSSADAECLLLRSHSVRTCAVATAVVSALLTGSVRASPPPITVKVATLNTKLGGESPWNPSEQIAALAAEQPDVVLLQEALYLQLDQYRNGISAALHDGGWSGSYARHCERGAAPTCDKYGAESVMVLTRLPIVDSDARLIWARDRTWAARGVVRVAVRAADGVVQIVSCHLPAGTTATRARLHWVAEFSQWAARLQQPQIVGGDFNDAPASRPVAAMKAVYADAWR